MIGFYTRWAAFVCSGLMAAAYWMAHGFQALLPIANQGELAALYCFVFLCISARGAGHVGCGCGECLATSLKAGFSQARPEEALMKRSVVRWAAVGAMVTVCALSGEADAEPQRSEWYIGGGVGAGWVHDMEERGWNRDTYCSPRTCDEPGLSENIEGISIPGYRWNYDLDLDLGSAFEIAVGRTFNRWRLEISAAQRKNDIDQDLHRQYLSGWQDSGSTVCTQQGCLEWRVQD